MKKALLLLLLVIVCYMSANAQGAVRVVESCEYPVGIIENKPLGKTMAFSVFTIRATDNTHEKGLSYTNKMAFPNKKPIITIQELQAFIDLCNQIRNKKEFPNCDFDKIRYSVETKSGTEVIISPTPSNQKDLSDMGDWWAGISDGDSYLMITKLSELERIFNQAIEVLNTLK